MRLQVSNQREQEMTIKYTYDEKKVEEWIQTGEFKKEKTTDELLNELQNISTKYAKKLQEKGISISKITFSTTGDCESKINMEY